VIERLEGRFCSPFPFWKGGEGDRTPRFHAPLFPFPIFLGKGSGVRVLSFRHSSMLTKPNAIVNSE
jgi:hypothetical protein